MLNKDQHNIGIFVDYHNIQISIREFFNLPYPDISLVKNYAEELGKIVFISIYADWNLLSKHRKYLLRLGGIKLINEPHIETNKGKRSETVDMRMAFDIGVCLEKSPEIDTFILVTGDNHFLPVLKQIRIRGKKILIIAEQNSLSYHLKRNFKHIITYQELVESFLKTSQKDSKISQLLPLKKEEGVVIYEKY